MENKFVFTALRFDDESKKAWAINEIISTDEEIFIPSKHEGIPVTHIGFISEYEEAKQVWYDYHHFKDEIIPGGWRQYARKMIIPATVKKIHIPAGIKHIGYKFYATNAKVEVVISDDNINKRGLMSELVYAKEMLN